MLDRNDFKDLVTYILIIGLFIMAFIIVKPVLSAIIYGLLLAYITHPLHKILLKKIKNSFISAFLICFGLFTIIITALGLIIGSLFKQGINIYFSLQKIDLSAIIVKSLPDFLSTETSTSIATSLNSSISHLIANLLDNFNKFIINLPGLGLKLVVVIFVFFFALKDGEKAINYIKSISPLKKETEEKFFKRFRDVTNSVLLGQILIGIAQGLTAGLGYLIFGVPNALLFTLLSIGASIIPMVGPWLVWVPINIFLLMSGRPEIAIGFLIYNMFLTSLIDNVLRPFIISKRTELNTAIVVVGMVGGLIVFGILGLIIGPLILAYVLLVLELYRKKNLDEDIIK